MLKLKKIAFGFLVCASVFGASSALESSPAYAVGTVPPAVQQGIDDATASVQALDGLALAALTVALVPLGAMLTLRFLNMVLSRV